ncbi:AraC family transcriptional regulator [Mucilaginibacter daejeonensis]|uniref:helix-turn-helix domain-containing protein n=1 Tax=Mucilaginibacter daejeonensis TaxID=398049 RepID=UPI001D178AD4|nr:AraC family transcriptional regulator [Mucilaginibacter daejeonensis]UEG52029.1 AraC family transcriptional regulator [Mucilaginibacter daejeonensis]
MKDIPIHKFADWASTTGIEIRHTSSAHLEKDVRSLGVHRDDHYIFFLAEEGESSMMVDFEEVTIRARSIYYVLPGQVHHRLDNNKISAWFIAIDTALVPSEYRSIYETRLLLQQPYILDDVQYKRFQDLITIMHEHFVQNTDSVFYHDILRSLLNSFLGMAACGYESQNSDNRKHTRPVQIANELKQLLALHYKTEKRPLAYAEMLNISEAYLNEAVKKVTGFPVSYWIMHEVMLEAKRLLYYSQYNVKEIAHQLGYDDHTYFSRIFKKLAGTTPLAFRASASSR